MEISELRTDKKVQFNTYGRMGGRTSVTGTIAGTFKGSIVPEANKMRAYHASIFQELPEEIQQITPTDHRKLDFILVVTNKQEMVYVATAWIMESTLEEISLTSDLISVTNWDKSKLSETDLRLLLSEFGVQVTSITTE